MALPAAVYGRCRITKRESFSDEGVVTFNNFRQNIVQRPHDATRLGVVGVDKLIHFLGVAAGAVDRADDGREPEPDPPEEGPP